MAYGITIQEDNDPAVYIAETALASLAVAANPGTFLVDTFPIMRYIPSWFPGAGWKKKAEYWRRIGEIFANGSWDTAKEQVVRIMRQ